MNKICIIIAVAFFVALSSPALAQGDVPTYYVCSMSRSEMNALTTARDKYDIPIGVMSSVAFNESGCNNNRVGIYGELCMFQIFPFNPNKRFGFTDRPTADNLRIIDVCADTAAKILRENHDRYCNTFTFNYIFDFDDLNAQWFCALAVYNSGTSVVYTKQISQAGAKYASLILKTRSNLVIHLYE